MAQVDKYSNVSYWLDSSKSDRGPHQRFGSRRLDRESVGKDRRRELGREPDYRLTRRESETESDKRFSRQLEDIAEEGLLYWRLCHERKSCQVILHQLWKLWHRRLKSSTTERGDQFIGSDCLQVQLHNFIFLLLRMWLLFKPLKEWPSFNTAPVVHLSRLVTKPTKWLVHPAKTQISLGIRPVWSESSLCAQWVAKDLSVRHVTKDPSVCHADSEDSDQTGRMPRLICVFAGRICHFVGFFTMRLICWEVQ